MTTLTESQGSLDVNLSDEWSSETLGAFGVDPNKKAPFRLYIFPNLLDEDVVPQLRDDINSSIKLKDKDNDLYKFKQSKDFKAEIPAKKLTPLLHEFIDVMLGKIRLHLQELSGLKLSSKNFDITASRYDVGNYLLCHNDDIGDNLKSHSRTLAFVYYLNSRPWSQEDGGAFILYDSDTLGEPVAINNRLMPRPNTLVVFHTSPVSWHAVEEVYCKDDFRLSINGWFHTDGPSRVVDSTRAIETSPYIFLKPIPLDERLERFFKESFNAQYLLEKTCTVIRKRFKRISEINLTNFMIKSRFDEISDALRETASNEDNLEHVGPYNKRNYKVIKVDKLPPVCKDLYDAFRSELFYMFLSRLTGLDLQPPSLKRTNASEIDADGDEDDYEEEEEDDDDDDDDDANADDADADDDDDGDDGNDTDGSEDETRKQMAFRSGALLKLAVASTSADYLEVAGTSSGCTQGSSSGPPIGGVVNINTDSDSDSSSSSPSTPPTPSRASTESLGSGTKSEPELKDAGLDDSGNLESTSAGRRDSSSSDTTSTTASITTSSGDSESTTSISVGNGGIDDEPEKVADKETDKEEDPASSAKQCEAQQTEDESGLDDTTIASNVEVAACSSSPIKSADDLVPSSSASAIEPDKQQEVCVAGGSASGSAEKANNGAERLPDELATASGAPSSLAEPSKRKAEKPTSRDLAGLDKRSPRKRKRKSDPLMRCEFRHLESGSYTIIHDYAYELGEKSALDVILHFNHDFRVKFDDGGYISYIDASPEDDPHDMDCELLTVEPKSNSLSMAYRCDEGTCRFLKYLTKAHRSSYQDLYCVYYERPDDLPNGRPTSEC